MSNVLVEWLKEPHVCGILLPPMKCVYTFIFRTCEEAVLQGAREVEIGTLKWVEDCIVGNRIGQNSIMLL